MNYGLSLIQMLQAPEVSPTVVLNTPADLATGISTTPTVNFTGTDGNSDTLEYNVQLDLASTFNSYGTAQGLLTNLVSYYKFDEGTGTSLADSFGSNNGTWVGTLDNQWASGKINTGGHFESGHATRVTVATGGILRGSTNFTIAGWIKPSTTTGQGTSGGAIYSERHPSAGNDILKFNYSDATNLTKIRLTYRNDAGTLDQIASTGTITDTNYHHVAVVKSGTGITFYIDGSSAGTGTLAANDTLTDTCTCLIGNDSRDGNSSYFGDVDELGLWTRALSSGDITALYNSTAGFQVTRSLLDKFSTLDSGFTAGHPFASGAATDLTVQAGDTLTASTTYYWRVRAIDPLGSNTYGAWTTAQSFTTSSGAVLRQLLTMLGIG